MARPGFDYAMHEIARRIDNVENERAVMYDSFRAFKTAMKRDGG